MIDLSSLHDLKIIVDSLNFDLKSLDVALNILHKLFQYQLYDLKVYTLYVDLKSFEVSLHNLKINLWSLENEIDFNIYNLTSTVF